MEYVKKRKISIAVAETYLSEVYYKVKDDQKKPYFGIGMQNASNGYEIKNIQLNKYFCLGAKDISIIDNGYIDTFVVFEGMFDFLASITYYQKSFKANIIILHSVVNIPKMLEIIKDQAKKIYLFLDNDQAGDIGTQKIQDYFLDKIDVADRRKVYQNYKDFGDFLKSVL